MPKSALILAAGAGTRFQPNLGMSKVLLPVAGRPLIVKLVEDIRHQLKIHHFIFVLGFDGERIRQTILDYIRDISAKFVMIDDYEKGPAIGMLAAEQFCPEEFYTFLGDEIYFNTDLVELSKIRQTGVRTICGLIKPAHKTEVLKNYSVEMFGNRIIKLTEKPDFVESSFMGVGSFLFNRSIFEAIKNTPISSKSGKVELIDSINYLAQKEIVSGAFLTGTYFNVNTKDDYQNALNVAERVSLIIPTLNEESSVREVISEFRNFVSEIIVVDNQSSDRTVEIAKSCEVIVHQVSVDGYGAAIKEGIKISRGNIIVLMEGDHTFRSLDLGSLIAALSDADMVIGTRTSNKNPPGSPMKGLLKAGNVVFGKILQLCWIKMAPSFTDVGCTYRAVWRDSYLRLADNLKSTGPEYIVDLTVEGLKNHMKIIEVPVSYFPRLGGESKHSSSLTKVSWTAAKMLRVIFSKKFLRG